VAVRLLYSSIQNANRQRRLETCVRRAIGQQAGDWTFCLVEPPRQSQYVAIVIDGPCGDSQTWCFDDADARPTVVRGTIMAALPKLLASDAHQTGPSRGRVRLMVSDRDDEGRHPA
jgi:hypothetical protein